MYYIYRHETPEGKSYIGKTLNPKARYKNGIWIYLEDYRKEEKRKSYH